MAGLSRQVIRLAVLLRCTPDHIRQMDPGEFLAILREANGG